MAIREQLSLASGEQLDKAYKHLKSKLCIEECVILSTCNRTELYTATRKSEESIAQARHFFHLTSNIDPEIIHQHHYHHTCSNAIYHLFCVCSGIDSMVTGENEIHAQVADALDYASKAGSCGLILSTLFQRALQTSKTIRRETAISSGTVSYGSAVTTLAKKYLLHQKNHSILLIGAGKMGEIIARRLKKNVKSSLYLANRNYNRAAALAKTLEISAIPMETLKEHMARADMIISCISSPDYIITLNILDQTKQTSRQNPIIFIDIGVPRNIDPDIQGLEGIILYNIDDIQMVIKEGLTKREKAAKEARKIVDEHTNDFMHWLNHSSVVPVIKALCNNFNDICNDELVRFISMHPHWKEEEREQIAILLKSIMQKILNTPILQLKKYADTGQGHWASQVIRSVFDLNMPSKDKDDAEN